MVVKSSENQYGSGAVMFHWFTAILILSMIPLGIYMHELPVGDLKETLYKAHIVMGIIIFVTTILRIVWKLMDNKVAELKTTPRYQQIMAKALHYIVYAMMLGAAGSGLGYIIFSGLGEQLFLADKVVWPNAHDFLPADVHEKLTIPMIPLLGLHIVAALYHQFVVKDGIFKRMWFKS
uniref:Cytochrome b561 bacterial/Ni-hydrogenase domain-containing protein n=1 Tax=OCS116 cluster bacterium TaxID=2030921 RepID=A0A2A4YTG8_9PROT